MDTIKFLSNNFLLFSSALTCGSAVLVMAFLYAYLSVFDSNLIWLVEFADLTKFLLIGAAFIASGVAFIGTNVDMIRNVKKIRRSRGCFLTLFILPLVIIQIYAAWIDFHQGKNIIKNLIMTATILCFMYFIFKIFEIVENDINFDNVFNTAIAAVATSYLIGAYFGLDLRARKEDMHTFVVKTLNSTAENTVISGHIVMILSHHIVVATGEFVQVFPTGDVIRMVSSKR